MVIAFPAGEEYLDANVDVDTLADGLIDFLNEERQRNADDAGLPDYYQPLVLNAIPGPQWLDGKDLATLVRAVDLVQRAQESLSTPTQTEGT